MLRVHSMALRISVVALLVLLFQIDIAKAVIVSPDDVPGLRVRLRADSGVASSGGFISAWADTSAGGVGNGNGVSSPVATANQPKLILNALNGLPVVRFDGDLSSGTATSDRMQSTLTMANMITSSAYTTFTVYKAGSVFRNTTPGWTNDAVFADTDGYLGLFLRNTGTLPAASMYAYNFSTGDNQASVATTIGNFNVVTTRLDSSVLYLDVLNGPSASVSSGSTATSGKLGLSLGLIDSQTAFRGDIAELLIYNRALTLAERTDVQNYLNEKWLPEPSSAAILVFGTALATLRRKSSRTA